jgi:hypothetical protein
MIFEDKFCLLVGVISFYLLNFEGVFLTVVFLPFEQSDTADPFFFLSKSLSVYCPASILMLNSA